MTHQYIGALVATAFRSAAQQQAPKHQQWVDASIKISFLRPSSLLISNVQRCGEMDLLLRAMEKEWRPPDAPVDPLLNPFHYQALLSDWWVGSAYEIVRLYLESEKGNARVEQLGHRLRLLRVPLEKHQIAADRSMSDPMVMVRIGPGPQSNYTYDPKDPSRTHIMPTAISARGSLMWHVVDIKASGSFWLERQQVADDFLEAFI